jgi:CubicO group peptidase (beta-lactamase class C family)
MYALILLTGLPGLLSAAGRQEGGLPEAKPETIGLDPDGLNRIDRAVEEAIQRREVPGAVVLVARKGKIGYFKAFGRRAVVPTSESMTLDTVFDMASLTKVMATTPSIMMLVEKGTLRLGDRVSRYLPRFTGGGKDAITLGQLLTHYSGLRPDFDLAVPWSGYSTAIERLWREKAEVVPGQEFIYSDLNFIALAEIVRTVTGKRIDDFVLEHLYQPLGMTDTRFNPPEAWRSRVAPTESRSRTLAYLGGAQTIPPSQAILRGEVHDPTAWRMEGVSGHAGLFSSARDVAIYAQMLLNGGSLEGKRIFAPLTVRAMTSPQSPREAQALRGYGWDIRTRYTAQRGDLWIEGFGHTGFTGTSLWVHPRSQTFVVILSNRVHPDGSGDATHLRGVIANIVASSIGP